ncbi:hypothetical protein BJF80_03780 [Serinicoccus sp. CUA-874]|nr:hypothetical protein BJF80_03780 [Serinicoccus sp. CUA-874]
MSRLPSRTVESLLRLRLRNWDSVWLKASELASEELMSFWNCPGPRTVVSRGRTSMRICP